VIQKSRNPWVKGQSVGIVSLKFQFLGKVFLMIFLETEVNVPCYLQNCHYLEQKDDQNDVSHQYSRFHGNARRDVELQTYLAVHSLGKNF
jgi:hypothetical protein